MEKGARRTGKTAWEIAQLYTDAFRRRHATRSTSRTRRCCAARPTTSPSRSRSSPTSRSNGYAYLTSDGVYFDTSKQADYGYLARLDINGPRGRQARRPRREAQPDRLRAVEVLAAGRDAADGMGQPVGQGLSRAGTSSARRWRRSTSATTSTSIAAARTTSRSTTPTRSRRPKARVGTRLANFWMHGYFLLSNDAKMAKSAGEFLRARVARRARLRSARVPLPVPHRALPRPAQLHVGGARRRGDGARPHAPRLPRAARRPATATPDAGADRALHRRDQRRPQPAARARRRVGDAARRPRRPARSARRCSRFDEVFGLRLAAWAPKEEDGARRREGAGRGAPRRAAREGLGRGRPPARRAAAAGWEMEDRPDGYALKRK